MVEIKFIEVQYQGRRFHIEYFQRKGSMGTILFLHGLGGAKENFWWATKHKALNGHNLISFDNPGTGNSSYYPETGLNVDDLVEITSLFINRLISENFYLLGASMGGLTMLNYILKYGHSKVKGLINIEGNLALEDCMFSGKVIKYSYEEFMSSGFHGGIQEMRQNPSCGYQTIANNIELNTDPTSYYNYSFQTVTFSSNGGLLKSFINLPLPKIFLHGDKNSHLSYIQELEHSGVLVKEISGSDHFLFYDNPADLYQTISGFIEGHADLA